MSMDVRTITKEHVKPVVVLPTKQRRCLQCLENFASTGPGNRICDDCKSGKKKTKRDEQSALPACAGWHHGRWRRMLNLQGASE